MSEVVGRNTRATRERRGWTQAVLQAQLERHGLKITRSAIAQLERGKRGVSVDELFALALALEIAPHFLLYPSRDQNVVVRRVFEDGDDNASLVQGWRLANWLWDPDMHALTGDNRSEERLHLEAVSDHLSGRDRHKKEKTISERETQMFEERIRDEFRRKQREDG